MRMGMTYPPARFDRLGTALSSFVFAPKKRVAPLRMIGRGLVG
jgi:hypothetical protein